MESTQVPTYFFLCVSYPRVRMPVKGTPMYEVLFSRIAQNSPSIRPLSVPLFFVGGLAGSIVISPSVSHSPTSCLSHSSSFTGGGIFGPSWAPRAAAPARSAARQPAATMVFMAPPGDGKSIAERIYPSVGGDGMSRRSQPREVLDGLGVTLLAGDDVEGGRRELVHHGLGVGPLREIDRLEVVPAGIAGIDPDPGDFLRLVPGQFLRPLLAARGAEHAGTIPFPRAEGTLEGPLPRGGRRVLAQEAGQRAGAAEGTGCRRDVLPFTLQRERRQVRLEEHDREERKPLVRPHPPSTEAAGDDSRPA